MTKSGINHKCGQIIAADDSTCHRLNRCQAYYWESIEKQAAVLVSYKTACAVYWRGVVWELGRWSNTTTWHVREFAHLMDAPVVSLYRRSGMSLSLYRACEERDWENAIDAVLNT